MVRPTALIIFALALAPVVLIGVGIFRTVFDRHDGTNQDGIWWPEFELSWVRRYLAAIATYVAAMLVLVPLVNGEPPMELTAGDRLCDLFVLVGSGVGVHFLKLSVVLALAVVVALLHAILM